jgi:hypothetical protein
MSLLFFGCFHQVDASLFLTDACEANLRKALLLLQAMPKALEADKAKPAPDTSSGSQTCFNVSRHTYASMASCLLCAI